MLYAEVWWGAFYYHMVKIARYVWDMFMYMPSVAFQCIAPVAGMSADLLSVAWMDGTGMDGLN